MERVRTLASFPGGRVAQGLYLDGAAREDARDPRIRAIASRFAHLAPSQRARALYGFVRGRVRYREDVAGEEFDSAVITLERGHDDCDGSARLLLALLLAAGLEARLRVVLYRRDPHWHVQVEVRWPGSDRERRAGPGGWMLADTILEGVELGQGAEAARVTRDGAYVTLQRPRHAPSWG
jgi:transglutaminase-like putative cysteine protease